MNITIVCVIIVVCLVCLIYLNKNREGFNNYTALYTLNGKCGLEWGEDIGNNEFNANWNCDGKSVPIMNEKNQIYTNIKGKTCGLEWNGGNPDSNNERNAKWDCKGNADPLIIESNKIYSMASGKKCGLEWQGGNPDSNNERNAKWDCNGNADSITKHKVRNGVVSKVEWIALPERNIPRDKSIKLIDDERYLPGAGLVLELENKEGRDVSDYVIITVNFDKGTLRGSPYGVPTSGYGYKVGDLLVGYQKTPPGGVSYGKKIMTQNRDKFIFKVTEVKDYVKGNPEKIQVTTSSTTTTPTTTSTTTTTTPTTTTTIPTTTSTTTTAFVPTESSCDYNNILDYVLQNSRKRNIKQKNIRKVIDRSCPLHPPKISGVLSSNNFMERPIAYHGEMPDPINEPTYWSSFGQLGQNTFGTIN